MSSNLFAQKKAETRLRIKILKTPLQVLNGHSLPFEGYKDKLISKSVLPPQYIVKKFSSSSNKAILDIIEDIEINDLKKYIPPKSVENDSGILISTGSFYGYDYILEYSGIRYAKKMGVRTDKKKSMDSVIVTYTPYVQAYVEIKYTFKHIDGTVLFEKDYTGDKKIISSSDLGGPYSQKSLAVKQKNEIGKAKLNDINNNLLKSFKSGLSEKLNSEFGFSCGDYTFKVIEGKGKKIDYSKSEKIVAELSELFKLGKKTCNLDNKEEYQNTIKPIVQKLKEGVEIWESLVSEYDKGNKKAKVSDKNIAYFYTNLAFGYLFLKDYDKALENLDKASQFKNKDKGYISYLRSITRDFRDRDNPKVHQAKYPESAYEKFYSVEIAHLQRAKQTNKNIAELPFKMMFDYSSLNFEKDIVISHKKEMSISGEAYYEISVTNKSEKPILLPYSYNNDKRWGVFSEIQLKNGKETKVGNSSSSKIDNEKLVISSSNYCLLLPNEECIINKVRVPKVNNTGKYQVNIHLKVDSKLSEKEKFSDHNAVRANSQSINFDSVFSFEDQIEATDL